MVTTTGKANCDTALYEGVTLDPTTPATFQASLTAAYTITRNANGSVTVADNAFVAAADLFAKGDGVDTLWNMENLRFCIGNDAVTKACNAFRDVPLAPVISVAPATVAFGNTFVNATSAAQTITVGNTGFSPLNVTGVTKTGTDAASFTPTNNCTAPVAPGATCTITVTFSPTTAGAKTATLAIASNDPSTPSKTVALTGTGVNPSVSLTPGSLTFAAQNVGTNSVVQTIVVRNTGTVRITGQTVTLAGANANQFVINNPLGCVGNLPVGATCNINVRFTPTAGTASGPRTATITVSSAIGGTVVANLTGTAVAPPTLTVANAVAFGRHPVNSTTTTTLAITNSGLATTNPLAIASFAVSGAGSAVFTVTAGTCTAPLAAGASCQLNVTFKPVAAATTSVGTLTITSNATGSPHTVTLRGNTP